MKRPRGKKRPRKRKGKAKRRKVNEREPGMRFRHFTTESSRRKVRQIQSPIKKVYEHQERPTLNYTFFSLFMKISYNSYEPQRKKIIKSKFLSETRAHDSQRISVYMLKSKSFNVPHERPATWNHSYFSMDVRNTVRPFFPRIVQRFRPK